jgi:hypothetical protein
MAKEPVNPLNGGLHGTESKRLQLDSRPDSLAPRRHRKRNGKDDRWCVRTVEKSSRAGND